MNHQNLSALGCLLRCIICIVIAAGAEAGSVVVKAKDDVESKSKTESTAAADRRAAYIRTMETVAKSFNVSRQSSDGKVECKMVAESALNWSDPVRHPELTNPGTVWIWHNNGRPQMIAEIFSRVQEPDKWNFYACTVSSDSVTCTDPTTEWVAPKSYYDPQDIPDAPEVATTRMARSLQMNRLAARFDAHQFWRGRYELRLLPRSIYRYEPVEGTILDGAVYTLVHGTNPEVLILIEAHQVTGVPAQWKVSFGSLAAARCVVRIDEQEFWSCEVDQGATSDPRRFFLRHVPVEETPAAETPDAR